MTIKNSSTVFSLAAAGLIGFNSISDANAGVPDAPEAWEKCAGVAKQAQNDCGSTDGRHSCSGKAEKDSDPTEWLYLPKGTCDKIPGGKVVGEKPASKMMKGEKAIIKGQEMMKKGKEIKEMMGK